ncbi:MAG TPA: hypothetical protein VLF94_06835 [Chlamydiales bacterium]|nr:hypothetical protein [Chlamydiales bacterium]
MNVKQRHRKILIGCVSASLFLHATALGFLQRYSLWFSSPQKSAQTTPWLSQVEKKERDQILKATFEPYAEAEKSAVSHKPEPEQTPALALSTAQMEEHDVLSRILFHTSFPQSELLTFPVLPTFALTAEPINLLEHLPKELIIPTPAKQTIVHFPPPLPTDTDVALAAKPPAVVQEAPSPLITYSEPLDSPLTGASSPIKAPTPIPLPNLPQLPTLAELETSSYSDSFDADLVFLPRDEGGYLFALTLIPRVDLKLSKIKQHFTFIIDRSNSITQERLTATKSAIHKALSELSPDDTFNIIAFDSKVEKMSPHSLPCTGKSFAFAEGFLEKVQLGSFFSSSDLYKPLFLTVPGRVENDEIYTAILLTDGEIFAKRQVPRAILHDWTQYNSGKVGLHALGLNSDAHTATLDATATLNKGKFTTAPTSRGLKRKLVKLIRTIQTPIAKNLYCKAISRSPQAKVQLFPKSSQMPHLYLDQPYVILGETDTLEDFILFVQGRVKDRWLNIKKTISFVNAKKGSKSLKKEWALQRAYILYENYARDENPQHIAEAEALLEPYDSPVAFR